MALHAERLAQLAPVIQEAAQTFLTRAEERLGLRLLVVFTWRSVREQWTLYAQGRQYRPESRTWDVVNPGALRTRARPGTSAHNVITRDGQPASLALDVVPLSADGQPQWQTPDATWTRLYEIAADCGLDPY